MYIQQDELKDGQIEQLIKAHLEEMKTFTSRKHSCPSVRRSKNMMSQYGVQGMERCFLAAEPSRSYQVNMVNSNR